MIILPVHQDTLAWHQARAKYYRTASRAPIVMGASPYQSRNDLMAEIKNGIVKEIDANTQALFDAGHAAEDQARKIVEGYLKAPLLPLTCLTDDEYLLASFDGINEELHAGFEHKLANEKLFAQIRAKELDPFYYWQLEQLVLVGNLDYIIFMCSDGTKERAAFLKYVPVPGRREQLLAGWRQFDADLANYQHVEIIPAATAAPVMALPALSIMVNGAITLTDNLAVFGAGLQAFIERIPAKPATDTDFANCKAACAKLQEAQDALDAGEAHALGQISSFDQMRRTKALLWDLARSTRLAVEKMVAAREAQIKMEIVSKAKAIYAAHVESLKAETGGPWIVISDPDFAGAIKGKRTIESLQNAVDTALANGKIAADASAMLIRANLACLKSAGAGFEFLFNDRLALISKPIDDLKNLIKIRIDGHKAAEANRIEAEREKIRAEEQAKAETEARAKLEAEQRSQREQADAKTRQEREAQAEIDKRINKELAAEEARLQAAKRAEQDRLADEESERKAMLRAEQDRADGIRRAEEALRQKMLDNDQLVAALYERIKDLKPYAAIAKACAAYLDKAQKKAA